MSDWVRFHRELCVGDKKGIRRAHRFVYMEISREARARRGRIALPKGMSDAEAVCDLLGGNRKEVVEALAILTDNADPMVRFEDEGGKRWLVVVEWSKWNPVDGTAAERQQRKRDEDRKKRDAERDVTRDGHGSDRDESRDVTDPRARALLSSPSGSVSDLREGVQGESSTPTPDDIPITEEIRTRCAMAGAREPTREDVLACLANARKRGHVRADWAYELVSWMIRGKRYDARGPVAAQPGVNRSPTLQPIVPIRRPPKEQAGG